MARLTLRPATLASVICFGIAVTPMGAQAPPAARPAFEAASVRLNRTGERTQNTILPGGRYSATNVPLRMMIRSAYGLQDFQLVGGPAWLGTDGYDVNAKAATEASPAQLFVMVRSLLEDRFSFASHRETRTLPVYALTRLDAGALGRQMRASSADCGAAPAASGRPRCGILMNFGEVRGTGATVAQMATSIAPFAGRAVQDRTGLVGPFDFELRFMPDAVGTIPPGAGPTAADADRPSLFTAVPEQLGLKLEASSAPIEVLVIDRIERPTED